MQAARGNRVLIGLCEFQFVRQGRLVERKGAGNLTDLAGDDVPDLERLVERLTTGAIDDVDEAVRAAHITRVYVMVAVASLEVPQQQRDRVAPYVHLLPIDLHSDRRKVSRRKDRVHIALDEARLSRREHSDHADFFLKHHRPLVVRGRVDTSISNETLRLILACTTLSAADNGREVATGSPRT